MRRLMYGFREWLDIESTGKGGSDDGFDMRAWEKDGSVTNVGEEGEEGERAAGGRLWQVQCKREKTLSPSAIEKIVADTIDAGGPPYGYILAAATNPSKKALDAFRSALKAKGVREFYFWGRDHLEDQLALPQNDDVLFTFFGLSSGPRRRSRVTEIRFALNNKNKLLKLMMGGEASEHEFVQPKRFLLRDIKDEEYPFLNEERGAESKPSWQEHEAVALMARGVLFKARTRYARLDRTRREFSLTKAVDRTFRHHPMDAQDKASREELGRSVERYWRRLPRSEQAVLTVYGFVAFEDMLLIDEKGDTARDCPHIFLDFGPDGPFSRFSHSMRSGHEDLDLKEWKYVEDGFPTNFKPASPGAVRPAAELCLPTAVANRLRSASGPGTAYVASSVRLKEGDIFRFDAGEHRGIDSYLEVTRIESSTVGKVLASHKGNEAYERSRLSEHAGREVNDSDAVTIVEYCSISTPSDGEGVNYMSEEWR